MRRLAKQSILSIALLFSVSCRQDPKPATPAPPTGDAAAQAQQVVQEAATGIVQRYEYVQDKNLVKAYWDPETRPSNQELIGKHTNLAIQLASRIFRRDSSIQTLDFVTSIPKDSINTTARVKALEDVVDRNKFLAIDWLNLSQKPAIAPFLRSTTSHWVEPKIQADIESKPIDRDILYTPFDTGTGR